MTIPANADVTSFAYALKYLYPDDVVLSAVYANSPFFARVPKTTEFVGELRVQPYKYANPAGRSQNFTHAQGNRTPSKGVKFLVTRKKDYAVGRLQNEVILASKLDKGAFMSDVEVEADGAIAAFKRSIGHALFGNGSGKLATINTPGADPTVTLYEPDNIVLFENGQSIVFAADEASALRSSGANLFVGDIDYDAGTFEAEDSTGAAVNVTTAVAAADDGDAMFIEGDYESAGDRNKLAGLSGWNPPASESVATAFLGVTRSANRALLAGSAYSSTSHPGCSTEDAIRLCLSKLGRLGKYPDSCYMNPDRWRTFSASLSNRETLIKETVNISIDGEVVATVGFNTIIIQEGQASVKCYSDYNCPVDTIHVVNNEKLELASLGQAPHWAEEGLTVSDADAKEFRLAMYGNLIAKDPACNARYDF